MQDSGNNYLHPLFPFQIYAEVDMAIKVFIKPGKRLKIGSGGKKVMPEPQKKTNLKVCRSDRQILKYTIKVRHPRNRSTAYNFSNFFKKA
jgi:hypothetical protein